MKQQKRITTFMVLFAFFFVAVYIAICVIGAMFSGVIAGAGQPDIQAGNYAAGQAAVSFYKNHIMAILLGSLLISSGISAALTFSGVLPWCRKPSQSPPL